MRTISNTAVDIKITKKNDVMVHVDADAGISMELVDHFTFDVPGAKYMPAFKAKAWDGKIRLFQSNNTIMYGLKYEIARFAESRNYTFTMFDESTDMTLEDVTGYVKELALPFEARDYQLDAIHYSLKHNRSLLISPTASGKSLIVYALIRYYLALGNKIIILVPTTSLVEQLFKDFIDYGFDSDSYCDKLYSGKTLTGKPIIISTWQSVHRKQKEFFKDFGCAVVDEAHLAKGNSLQGIMKKMTNCKYRFGLTGTLDGKETNVLTLSGMFSHPYIVTTTRKLIDEGSVADLKINCIVLNHSDKDKEAAKMYKTYQEECDYLAINPSRNAFICQLATMLKGNTLVLFQYVEKHGIPLFEQIKGMTDKECRYVSGMIKTDEREEIREYVENNDDVIIVASNQTYSTGINIKNLHNIIFAHPTKSQVRILQSIGRGLRSHDSKDKCNVYDIADDIRKAKKSKNYTLVHFYERLNIYRNSEFDIGINKIDL
jgi:superfamily II DNA or RNA helicase